MLGARLVVSVVVPFKIVRNNRPQTGCLYFDDLSHLVLITDVWATGKEHELRCTWRRVFTTRRISKKTYRGRWQPVRNTVTEDRT